MDFKKKLQNFYRIFANGSNNGGDETDSQNEIPTESEDNLSESVNRNNELVNNMEKDITSRKSENMNIVEVEQGVNDLQVINGEPPYKRRRHNHEIQNKNYESNHKNIVSTQTQNINNTRANINVQNNIQNTYINEPEKPPKPITNKKYPMPDPVNSFRGRENELIRIDEYFEKNDIVVISGIGGIGKTELAINYVSQYEGKYDKNIMWINGENEQELKSSFERIAEFLEIKPHTSISVTVQKVYSYFQSTKCIFVIDNAEDRQSIIDFLPSKVIHSDKKQYILITSQYSKWDNVPTIHLDNLSQKATLEIIKIILDTWYKEQDEKYWIELAEFLNYFPLALQIVVSHVHEDMEACDGFFDFREYIDQLKEAKKDFVDENVLVSSGNKYNKCLYSAVIVSVEKIKKYKSPDSPAALKILYIMAYLNPTYIKFDLFLFLKLTKPEVFKSLFILTKFSFIKKKHEYKQVYEIHRLIQYVIQCYQKQNDIMSKYLHLTLDTKVTSTNREWEYHEVYIYSHCEQNFDLIANYYNLKNISNSFVQELIFHDCFKLLKSIFSKENNEDVKNLINSYDLIPFTMKNGTVELFDIILQYGDCDVNKTYDDRGRTLLHYATERMDIAKIKKLMELGTRVDIADQKGFTVLHSTLNSGKIYTEVEDKVIECLNILMEYSQLDVNALDKIHRSPLFYAAENLLSKCMSWLIMRNARVDISDKDGVTPLRATRKLWRNKNEDKVLECLNILIKTGQADVNDLGGTNQSLLFYAAKMWLPKCMKCLLKGGARVDIAEHLHEILKAGVLYTNEDNISEFLNVLIEIGLVDFNVVDRDGCTPLFYAVEKLNTTYIRCLIERNARVDIADKKGVTPLLALFKTWSISDEDEDKVLECLNILTDNRTSQADVNALDKRGGSALIYAAERCFYKCMKWLIAHKAHVCVTDINGNTPINVLFNFFGTHFSLNPQNIIEIGKLLLEHGATISNSLLPTSVKCGKIEVVKWLVEDHNCDINAQDARGNTALHYLASTSCPYLPDFNLEEICKYLLEKGADRNIQNQDGYTSVQVISESENKFLLKCFN